MEHMSLRERQRIAREEAILDAAHSLLMEQGYAEMSMDELAARVSASKGTIYQHFPSKEDLITHVIIRQMRHGEERILSRDPALPAVLRLESALRAGLGKRVGSWLTQVAMLPHTIKEHPNYIEQQARLFAVMSQLVEDAKAQGDVKPTVPTPIIVQLLMNLYRADFSTLIQQGICTPEEIGNSLIDIVFQGIRTH